ncbi:phage tail tape measure protein [Hansschlegelia zhihuaiae]|uniref:Phage tail tape measure protein n=1 Tax=Hansschlegelia zhihuaiae TaxID=405005 RepID=A0A4Q0M471_9HYPH|nr:phage tail tape measure protein [Hansschlegelia zhihuaiae]RXF67684.1 phage tail tape measure protein [Hansschlegelia zhihuaiae]
MTSRVVEAKLLITGEDRASRVLAQVEKATRQTSKAIAEQARAAKVAAEIEKFAKAHERANKALSDVEAYKKARANAASVEASHKLARARADELAEALDRTREAQKRLSAEKGPQAATELAAKVKQLTDQHKAAERQVRSTASAVRIQAQAFDGAKAAMRAYGVPITDLDRHEGRLKRSIEATTKAIREQEGAARKAAEARRRMLQAEEARLQRRAARGEVIGAAGAAAGVYAGYKGRQIAGDAITSAAEFDIAVRKQRQFTDISAADQARLLAQAKKIGQETQFSNIDVVRAQTASMQGLPAGFAPTLKAEIAAGIVENVRNYATLMETDLKEGAETIRSYLQTTGKDISTREKALDEARKATNQIVKMAKLGGMSGEDASQFVKYAAAPGTTAGLSTDTMLSLGALARRGGLRGDEAGVFMRSTASKLVAPTKKGRAALSAAGINYDDFVRMPDRLDTGALERSFQTEMGKGFTPQVRARIDQINADKRLISDRERYVEAVTSAVAPILGKKKDGTVRASDSQVAAKAAGAYHKIAAESVDAEGLLDAAMSKNMTLAQLNAWLTDKHGGKGSITQRQWDEFRAARTEIAKTGDDPDFAKKRADAVMAGVGGAVENLRGSVENLVLAVGEANSGLIKFAADGIGKGLDAFSKLDSSTQQIVSLGAGAAATLATLKASGYLTGKLLGTTALSGSAAALSGSAGELAVAAKALDAAAIKLGAAGGGDDVAKRMGKSATSAGAGSTIGAVVARSAAAGGLAATAAGSMLLAEGWNKTERDRSFMAALERRRAERKGEDLPYLKADAEKARAELAEIEKRSAEIASDEDKTPVLLSLRSRKAIIEERLREIERLIEERLKQSGEAAGVKAGQGIADGVKAKTPDVEGAASTLFKRMSAVFATGIDIPLRLAPDGSFGGGGGGGGLIRASYGGGPAARSFSGALPVGRGSGVGHVASQAERAAYIRESALRHGIDPEVALRVAQSEGFYGYVGDQGRSFGDWQLFTGGGLGNKALKSGINVRDPRTWREQTDFALKEAAKNGWSPWYGAAKAGVSRWRGIRGGNSPKGRTLAPRDDAATPGALGPTGDVPSFGGGSAQAEMLRAADRMNEAVGRFERARLNAGLMVEITGSGRDAARVKGMRSTSEGPITADMGISMPHVRSTRVG